MSCPGLSAADCPHSHKAAAGGHKKSHRSKKCKKDKKKKSHERRFPSCPKDCRCAICVVICDCDECCPPRCPSPPRCDSCDDWNNDCSGCQVTRCKPDCRKPCCYEPERHNYDCGQQSRCSSDCRESCCRPACPSNCQQSCCQRYSPYRDPPTQPRAECQRIVDRYPTRYGYITITAAVTPVPATYTTLGQVIVYQVTITNTGNSELVAPLQIHDSYLGTLNYTTRTINPMSSIVIDINRTIVAADLLVPFISSVLTVYADVGCDTLLRAPAVAVVVTRVIPQ